MAVMRRWCALGWVAVMLLGGCGSDGGAPVADLNQPAPRTTWALRHRVVESGQLKVTSTTIGPYEESTGVSLGPGGGKSCFVSVAAPGQGGPDLMVGEKVPTQFRGDAAVRNGSGAEGAYLTWQLADGSG